MVDGCHKRYCWGMHGKSFAAVPLKMRTGTTPAVEQALRQIDTSLKHGNYGAITAANQIELWTALSEWCAVNLTALENAAKGAGASEIG